MLERLSRGEILISDGATWTYLENHGLQPGECPEELNVSRQEVVEGMARAYFEAGSSMVLTNSFGANRFRLRRYGYEGRVREFNRLAATIARNQAPPGHYVVGSVGPTGEFLEPLGRVGESEMREAFIEQVIALEEGGADGVLIETMVTIEETILAINAAKEHTDLVVMATMVFERGHPGFLSMMGSSPDQVVKELQAAGAEVVGANCGAGIDVMVDLAREFRRATDGYLLVQPNAGVPSIKDARVVYPESPDYMAEGFKKLAGMGINVIGGCCGTGPEHIRALTTTLCGRP